MITIRVTWSIVPQSRPCLRPPRPDPLPSGKTSWSGPITCFYRQHIRIGTIVVSKTAVDTSALTEADEATVTARGRLAVLRHKQFRLVLLERLLSTSATGISLVALSFAVIEITKTAAHPDGSASALSYVLAAQLAPVLIFTLVGGILADRFRPQRVMVASNVFAASGEGVAAVLLLTHNAHTWSLLLCAMCAGIGAALFYPASQALTPRLV